MDSSTKKGIIKSFNEKPKTGIEKIKTWCTEYNKDFVEGAAKFFYEEKNNLNLEFVGDYLGTDGQDNKKILKSFAKRFNFKEKDYLESLREFLGTFKLPGEAQKIDRLVESFGSHYYEQNLNGEIKGKDAAYILAFQTIMLNTDLHNPSIAESKKMTFEELKNNLRDTNEKQNFSDELLRKIYDGIKSNPFKLNFTEIAAGYEIAYINSKNDKTFKKLDDFLTAKMDINNVFPGLKNNITAEHKQPKTWLNKFTGYEGSVLIRAEDTEVEIQVYKPHILSKWFLGEKNKLVIQPKQQSEQSLKLAAQIAASFETKVTSISATYDYLKEDLKNEYENAANPKKVLTTAPSVVLLQESIKEVTKDLQKHDSEIPDPPNIPLASKENFKDLIEADLGKRAPNKSLSLDEELKKKVASKQIKDPSESPIKKTEEKIDNHAKRLEELKQKQEELENKKKELEAKKANPNISREERWKIAGELEGIDNQFRNIEKETKTIQEASSREKQFDNQNNTQVNKKEPTAADLQQQGAMAAIKRMKETHKEAEAGVTKPTSMNNIINFGHSIPPGIIPPPPPLPGTIPPPPPLPKSGAYIPVSPTMAEAETPIPQTVQKEVETISKQITSTDNKENKHKNELEKVIREKAAKRGIGM